VPSRRPLIELFLQARPASGEGDAVNHEPIEALITSGLQAARTDWPGVALSDELFVPYVAARLDGPVVEGLQKLAWSDLYIACACSRADDAAIRAFEARYFGDVDRALRRMRLTADQVDDVKQVVRQTLLGSGRIADYNGRGPLRAWLRVSAVRAGLKLLRKTGREVLVEDDSALESNVSAEDPELTYIKELYRPAFRQAFQESLQSLADRDKNLLRQHVVDGLSIDEIGDLYRVHRATAARWVIKARDHLLVFTRQRFMDLAHVNPTECESIFRMVRSGFRVTFKRHLQGR
jgi:RNA polymerase sigma-70 factor, ECF subfamily